MQPGSAVRVEMTKWPDRPHWCFDATYLGSDEHGDWLGVRPGTAMARPGATYVAPVAQVLLAPTQPVRQVNGSAPTAAQTLAQLDPEHGYLATFHAEGGVVEVYVDIATPPVWDGRVLRSVDLDLDVIRAPRGRVWVDDEDEFADHRVRFAYPEDLVAHAAVSCSFVLTAVNDRLPPYDGPTAAGWLAQV
ncbi:DUF402 domain-containing protein [Nocardioides sp.]|uniref:DUF402 domain-containing protein n=1 Tax=Nocardioides sp. TaxID=35761 RepID=UPI002732FFBF|nr:DUF402 domain-containing protein [Nocardioides sp.]MDP3891014.1 DUF402 domain-containing protein [Nocardioides sp.]